MTFMDFFLGTGITSALSALLGFFILTLGIHAGSRIVGVPRHLLIALKAATIVSIVVVLLSFIPFDSFFLLVISGAVQIFVIAYSYRVTFVKAVFITLASFLALVVLEMILPVALLAVAAPVGL